MGVIRDPASVAQFKQSIAEEQAQIDTDRGMIDQF